MSVPIREIKTHYSEGFIGMDGTKYFLEDKVSAGRIAYAQVKMFELLACQSILSFHEYQEKLVGLMNAQKYHDASVLIDNQSKGVDLISSQSGFALLYCCCIFNTEDEDRTSVDVNMFEKKIENWADIDHSFFLNVCLNTISGLTQSYKEIALFSEIARMELMKVLQSSSTIGNSSGSASLS